MWQIQCIQNKDVEMYPSKGDNHIYLVLKQIAG